MLGDAPDSTVTPSKQNRSRLVSLAAPSVIELVTNAQEGLPIPIALEYIKTELKFAEFSLSIAGKISTQKLHKIIELASSLC